MPRKSNLANPQEDKEKELLKRIQELENLVAGKKDSPSSEFDEIKIASDDRIQVMSLFMGKLNLSTEPYGKGRTISFNEFGQIKTITYNDLVSIINSQERFLQSGFFYILDKRVIEKHSLYPIYESLLNKEMLERVFSLSSESVSLYESANEYQKEMIETFLIRKIANDESVDFNMIHKISKISGVDIFEKAKELKEITLAS